jgi:hypothetical protein
MFAVENSDQILPEQSEIQIGRRQVVGEGFTWPATA